MNIRSMDELLNELREDFHALIRHSQADPACSKETVLIRLHQLALRFDYIRSPAAEDPEFTGEDCEHFPRCECDQQARMCATFRSREAEQPA